MAYALFAAVQILVLNPLAAVPGASLRDIYAHVVEAGESMGGSGSPRQSGGSSSVVTIALLGAAGGAGDVCASGGSAVPCGGGTWRARLLLGELRPRMALADSYFIMGDHQQWATPCTSPAVWRSSLCSCMASPRRHIASSTLRRDPAGHAELAC